MTTPKPYNLTPADTDLNVVEDDGGILTISPELKARLERQLQAIKNGTAKLTSWEDIKQKYNLSL